MNGANTNNNKLKTVIQGGAVGISIVLIFLIGFIFNKYDKMANNHATQFIAALEKSTRTDQELLGAIKEMSGNFKDLEGAIGKFMDYVAPEPPWANYP